MNKNSFTASIKQLVLKLPRVIINETEQQQNFLPESAAMSKWKVESHFSSNYSKFSKSFKAYLIIKIKLKPLFRAYVQKYFDGNELHDVKIKV